MKTQNLLRSLSILVAFATILSFEVTSVSAQPPAPVPVSPADGSMIVIPTFSWQASSEAEYYEVEVGPQSNPVTVYWSDTTYNLTLTPNNASQFTNEPLYWRVRAYDSSHIAGPWSSKVNFTKYIPAPALTDPASGDTIVEPVLEWQVVEGAAYYKVELSTSPTFYTLDHTYTTYNTQLTPDAAIAHNTPWYWRVSGVDAENHVGTPSAGWTFDKHIPAPTLVSPADNDTIVEPILEWQVVEGAAYYKVELSTSPTFVPVDHTYTTYNTQLTPNVTIAHITYWYWRVSGVDADGHVGTPSAARTFTLNAPPAPSDSTPQLQTPAHGETIAADPNFSWTRVIDAADYHLIVSRASDFSSSYDYVYTDYASFTPYTDGSSGQQNAYPNGTYYWKVEARNSGGTVIATSAARSFTKQMTLPLIAPADVATLTTDPTFEWTRVVGARDYHLIVSKEPDFSPSYDYVYTDYVSFTPYTYGSSGQQNAYPNGTYYWKVEARGSSGTVIVTSAARRFTKQMTLPLIAPADVTTLTTDPIFQWTQVVGARDYHLVVSRDPDFSPSYDYVYTDYPTFTPYAAGQQTAYADGIYYWKVEARAHGGTVIVTSDGWTFTIDSSFYLYLPIIIK